MTEHCYAGLGYQNGKYKEQTQTEICIQIREKFILNCNKKYSIVKGGRNVVKHSQAQPIAWLRVALL